MQPSEKAVKTRSEGGRKSRDEGEMRKNADRRERPHPLPKQSWNVATIILGTPCADRISFSIIPDNDIEGYIEYGSSAESSKKTTQQQIYKDKVPAQLTINGLSVNTEYTYRLRYRKPGESQFASGPEYHFHTQRLPGSSFTFEIQGDSHPERSPKAHDPLLYEQMLTDVAKERPDFYFCMGDDFSVDALPGVTAESVERVYRKQLPYLGLVANSSPLFLVNGNHEQAAKYNLNGTADNVAVWAQVNRNRFFPQPAPDDFYGGNEKPVENIGFLRNYYSWTWGDALFVVIDPYWHSEVPVDNVFEGGKKRRDLWNVTLGETQYEWLKHTLSMSRSKYKFVFAHHVSGTGRGGVEMADFYEWGGKNKMGEWEFTQKRPGWEMPVQQLMVQNKVTIFFQGHDHVYARQEKDGVIYQTMPYPADPKYALNNAEAYESGTVLPGSGRVRVDVSPEEVNVTYLRSILPQDEKEEFKNGMIFHSYKIFANKK